MDLSKMIIAGDVDKVKEILSSQDIDIKEIMKGVEFAAGKNPEVLKLLLPYVYRTSYLKYAFDLAISYKQPKSLKMIVEKIKNEDKDFLQTLSTDSLTSSVIHGNIESIKIILPFANVKHQGSEALYIACVAKGDNEIIDLLFDYCDVDDLYDVYAKIERLKIDKIMHHREGVSYFKEKYRIFQSKENLQDNLEDIEKNKKKRKNKIL